MKSLLLLIYLCPLQGDALALGRPHHSVVEEDEAELLEPGEPEIAVLNIIRHGEDCNREALHGLQDRGLRRAQYLARCMRGKNKSDALPFGPPTVLIAAHTELKRPVQTLTPLSEALNVTLHQKCKNVEYGTEWRQEALKCYKQTILDSLHDNGTIVMALTWKAMMETVEFLEVPDWQQWLDDKEQRAMAVPDIRGNPSHWPNYECAAPGWPAEFNSRYDWREECMGRPSHIGRLDRRHMTAVKRQEIELKIGGGPTCTDEIWHVKFSRQRGSKRADAWKPVSITSMWQGFRSGLLDTACMDSLRSRH